MWSIAPCVDQASLVGCVGRPRFFNDNKLSKDFCLILAKQWSDSIDLKGLLNSLTGMFSLVKVSAQKISILTDHMGAQPVYCAS